MPLSILAILTEANAVDATLAASVAAASIDPGARIEVLHVRVDPAKLARTDEEMAIMRFAERGRGSAAGRSADVRRRFEAWAGAHGDARVNWRELVAEERPAIAEESIAADLIVLAQPVGQDTHAPLDAAIFKSHRPTLVVPHNWAGSDGGASLTGHMVIGWNAEDEARRAVHGSRRWLAHAERITVVTVADEDGDDSARKDAAEIRALLADASGPIDLVRVSDHGGEGATLMREAASRAATSLVIGGRHESAIIAWLGGSASHDILKAGPLPTFIAR